MDNNKILKTAIGFTLVETVIVLAILAIAMAIAIPNVMSWLPNYRLKAAARDLYSNMQKAKTEALKRNCSVGITFSTVMFPAQGGGYTVFIDNGDGAGIADNAVQDGGEMTLLAITMPSGCTLYTASFQGSPRTGYNSRGFPLGNRTGSIRLRNNNSVWYEMALSNSGYPKIRQSFDGINWN
ncbi:GspH/FimT family pseudopilin [uncultured Desulfobacter sp.]|uniref:GspH/FimT family pseudopilin n=1 Tax=uncultured Desulfobacter sp. TaxID=240139 RepID=UPI00374819FC